MFTGFPLMKDDLLLKGDSHSNFIVYFSNRKLTLSPHTPYLLATGGPITLNRSLPAVEFTDAGDILKYVLHKERERAS